MQTDRPSRHWNTFRTIPAIFCVLLLSMLAIPSAIAQNSPPASHYRNPILFADYSDPDVIRDHNDYYLVASSFHFSPGLPILHSRDLVHWEIVGHALKRLPFAPQYDMKDGSRYGGGVWAPSVRFHDGLFYIYFPTPDEGIFVVTAPRMTGPWSDPVAVIPGPGWEDPCPFWDDDGKAYLVHSKLHAGPLFLHRMAPDGKSVLDEGKIIVQDPQSLPVLEGPKFYKRHGWYYIFAPFGGVGTGAQVVLRSHDIYGPYEHRVVLAQGSTAINGPHQGGYVETPDGKGYFLHFQQAAAHGRIVHLQPVRWQDDWPLMGDVAAGDTKGQPVAQAPLPAMIPGAARTHPQTSDDFASRTLNPLWEWNHNPDNAHWSLTANPGHLRLTPTYAPDLLHARNTLTETMQDESLEFTTRLNLGHMISGDRAGISIFDKNLGYLAVVDLQGKEQLTLSINNVETAGPTVPNTTIDLRAVVHGNVATYFYSLDNGSHFSSLGSPVPLSFSWWKGARPALLAFHTDPGRTSSSYVDFDWVHYSALPSPPASPPSR